MDNDLDFGSGFTGRWASWSPDRELNPQYEGFADLEKASLILTCPHGDGAVSVHPPEYNEIFNDTGWTVESWEPLTLSPSILRNECGCHGYIREGKWVSA